MESGQEFFQLTVEASEDRTTLRVGGEFDTHAARSFDRAVDEAAEGKPERVDIDLGAVSFIDSSGLRSLVRAQRVFSATGTMTLKNTQPTTMRLLDITGLAEEFTVG